MYKANFNHNIRPIDDFGFRRKGSDQRPNFVYNTHVSDSYSVISGDAKCIKKILNRGDTLMLSGKIKSKRASIEPGSLWQ